MEKGLQPSTKKRRYEVLDIIRGITLISMIAYHGSWDLVYLFGKQWDWYYSTIGYVWQQSICWSFIFLSGFCWNFGRKHYMRGWIVFCGGAVITAVTTAFMYDSRVIFGILTFMGSAMLLLSLLEKVLKKIPPSGGLILSVLFFFVFRNINRGSLGFERIQLCSLPESLYQNLFTTYLGFPKPGFYSSDYFAILPWIFLFLAGYYFYGIMIRKCEMSFFHCDGCRGLQFIGKHSLPIYMLHQPILFALLTGLNQIGLI